MAAQYSYSYRPFLVFFLSARLGEIKTMSEKIPKLRQEVTRLEAKSMQIPQLEEELNIMGGDPAKGLKAPAGKRRHTDFFARDFFTW